MSRDDDRGSIAPLVPIIMFALLLLGGLVVDGSRELNSRGDARAYAEEAARAGATAIEPADPELELDKGKAQQLVGAYCRAIQLPQQGDAKVSDCHFVDITPATTCNDQTSDIVVNVSVTIRTDTTLLGMAGFTHFDTTAVASARPYEQTFDPQHPYC